MSSSTRREGLGAQLDAARHGAEEIGIAEGDGGGGDRIRRLRRQHRQPLGQHEVAHRGVRALLLLAAEGQQDDRALGQTLAELHEGHVLQGVLAQRHRSQPSFR